MFPWLSSVTRFSGFGRSSEVMATVRGPQEQRRGIDGARGHHYDLRRIVLAVAVAPHDDLVHRAARCSRLQSIHEGVGQERDVGELERGIHREHLRVGLGPDQAGIAVAGGAADARAAIRALLVELDAERGVEWLQARTGEVLRQVLHARLVAHRRVRVRLRGVGIRRVLTALAVHMVHAFRARVVGLHLLVSDRPGRRDATVVPQLAEVGLAQAEQRGAVELHQRASASPGPDHDDVVCVRHATSSPFVAHGLPLVTGL